jgi:hypothetical protein
MDTYILDQDFQKVVTQHILMYTLNTRLHKNLVINFESDSYYLHFVQNA